MQALFPDERNHPPHSCPNCHIAARPKRRRYRSYVGEISPAPENLINCAFQATAPNEKRLIDISEFHISAGNVYLSPKIDCFESMGVSWSIGISPGAELVSTMLDAAIETVTASDEKPIIHSDRGGHYRWPDATLKGTSNNPLASMAAEQITGAFVTAWHLA